MRRLCVMILALASCMLLMGAVNQPAPVSPTKNFYVNDYAGVLIREHREKISSLAAELYDKTGVQAVVLAINDLSGLAPDDYARSVISRWDIGGAGENGVLLLYDRQNKQAFLFSGNGLTDALAADAPLPLLRKSTAIQFTDQAVSADLINLYKAVLSEIYTGLDAAPDEELAARLEEEKADVSKAWIIFIVVALVAMLRSIRVSRKYRQKYLYRHQSKRRVFSGGLKDDDIEARAKGRAAARSGKVSREGFIIHREPEDEESTDI